jgi:hypothetical protein
MKNPEAGQCPAVYARYNKKNIMLDSGLYIIINVLMINKDFFMYVQYI